MGGSVDSSKWKPRRLRGTPANVFCTKVSLAFLTIASAIGVIYHFLPINKKIKEHYERDFNISEEEKSRRYFMGLVPQQSSKSIENIIEEKKKIFSER